VSSIGEKSSVPKVSYTPAMCLYPYLFWIALAAGIIR
jgi:hypothetical protein